MYKKILGLKSEIYTIKDLGIPIDKHDIPYLFLLDKSMRLKMLFIPVNGESKLTDVYLNVLQLHMDKL
jgi:hypothetical protein